MHRLANGDDQRAHVSFKNAPDRGDAECVRLADLSGVNDKALLTQAAIKFRKGELGISGKMKRGDDVALHFRIEIDFETEALHGAHEGAMVGGVAGSARSDAALQIQLTQRLVKSEDRMRRRGVAKLAVLFKALPLAEQVQAQAARAALGGKQPLAARDHERKTGHSFQTFVWGANQEIDPGRVEIHRHPAKAADGVHDVTAAHLVHYSAN